MAKPVTRCSTGSEAKAEERSGRCVTDDLLTQRFTPYVAQNISGGFRKMERAFFTSLSNLCRLYNMPKWDYSAYCYPLNISMAYKETSKRLKEMDSELRLAIVYENAGVTLATYKTLSHNYSLYYISVRPLFDLFRQKQRKDLSALLLSVYACVYKMLKVPFYSDRYSYLHGVYEMQREYCAEGGITSAGESEYIQTINRAIYCGRKLYKKLRGVKNIALFGTRIKNFKPVTAPEKELKKTAIALYQLYREFPGRSMSDSLNTAFLDPEADYRIYFEQYISFIWDAKDCLSESIIEHLNCDVQEATDEECPCSVQLFDQPQEAETIDLSFATRLYELADQLSNYVIKL